MKGTWALRMVQISRDHPEFTNMYNDGLKCYNNDQLYTIVALSEYVCNTDFLVNCVCLSTPVLYFISIVCLSVL